MLLFVAIGVCLGVFSNFCTSAAEPTVQSSIVPTSNNTVEEDNDSYYPFQDWSDPFDWKLIKAFSSPKYKNVLASPVSLRLVLALLYEGSSGVTEKEFQSILQFPVQKQFVRENFAHIIEALKGGDRKEYVLNFGTRIFLDKEVTPQQTYAAKAFTNYDTNIEPTNFSHPLEASKAINSWIEKVTNGKVAQMVKADDIENDIMLIGNAVFFKGTWNHQFPKNLTKNGGFYVSPNEVVDVPYMRTTNKFFYFESRELDAKILRLPYQGKRFALFVVLPNSKGGLEDLIRTISLKTLHRQLYLMDYVPVEVSLPKFKFTFEERYTKILQDFGLQQMFQNTASFPGIARGRSNLLRMLVVSDIIQKTGIELDEEGSVVYSATNVQFENKFGEADNTFNATHPFLFFIEEQTRGSILFIGKVTNPLEVESIPVPSRFAENAIPKQQSQPQSSSSSSSASAAGKQLRVEMSPRGFRMYTTTASANNGTTEA